MGVYEWNGRLYDALIYLLTRGREERIKTRVVAKLGLQPNARVLDWGAGTGMSLKPIQQHLQEGSIYAVERSPSMLKHALARVAANEKLQIYFILGDGLTLALPEKVDAAVACYSLGVLEPDQFEKGAEAIWRNLKPTGKVAIVETQIAAPKNALERLYKRVLKTVCRAFFADKCSDQLLPTVERFFERIAVDHVPQMDSIAFLGRRREIVLPRASLP
jgi:ubiquinone/menaquinone biosynthesis C-methylase UbiE